MDETAVTMETTATEAPISEPTPEPIADAPSSAEPAPEISLGEDGEVQYGDSFFSENDTGPESAGANTAVQATDYTDDELRDTPWERWDPARISGDVKRYIPLLQEQMRRRAAAAEMMRAAAAQSQQQPQQQPIAPKEAQKKIAAEAARLARERLELGEDDPLDFYEPEHVAALSIAAQEVRERERANEARTAQIAQQQRDFMNFTADMAARSDFAEFDQWVTARLAAAGMHPNQLKDYVERTGDIAGVQQRIADWYQFWRTNGNGKPARQVPRIPAVETASGAVGGKKVINLREFGAMDEEDQARALMEVGLV